MQFTPKEVARLIGQRRFGYMAGGAAVVVSTIFAIRTLAPEPVATHEAAISSDTSSVVVSTDSADTAEAATAPTREGLPARPVVAAHERVPKPAAIRGLYLNAWAAGSPRKLDKLLGIANRTEINAFVIDVKEGGEISYRSAVPLAAEIGADQQYIRNIQGVLAKLKANGIYPIARIVVFKDKTLARAKPAWAIQKADGSLWQDHHGDVWVDSFNKHVWDYNIAIAREAVALGFSEVQWDYVRFPDVPRSYMRTAVWPAQQGRTKEDAIREFLNYSRSQLSDLGVPVTADVFGLTVSAHDDMGIGQLWEKMADATDVLLPMVYPSHFARGSYGIAYPNAEPYNTIRTSMAHALKRMQGVSSAASIRPWLQDFTLGAPRYGAEHVRAQIAAVYDAGLEEWILWNPGSNYTVGALASRDGVAPAIAIPGRKPPADKPSVTEVKADTVAKKPVSDTVRRVGPRLWGLPLRLDTTKKTRPDATR
ncbi:MAG: putative glycoside hydrolase [Longimicrobiales bacterium]